MTWQASVSAKMSSADIRSRFFLRAGEFRIPVAGIELAEAHPITGGEFRALDALAIHPGAVGGFQIRDLERAVRLLDEFRVETADVSVLDDDLVARISAKREPVLDQVEDELISVVEIERQIRHEGGREPLR